jgi:hypothetical protein
MRADFSARNAAAFSATNAVIARAHDLENGMLPQVDDIVACVLDCF